MTTEAYPYDRRHSMRYTFISKGRNGAIVKAVEFTATSNKLILNLGFGDINPDGTIDDEANSNNNDLVKIMATIIAIIKDFTNQFPSYKIIFTGSTQIRTALYHRILKNYSEEFSKEFILTALEQMGKDKYHEVPFEAGINNYVAFFIKRK